MNNIEIEIPKELYTHAKNHKIVIMVGAGVSSIPPSSLPNWNELNSMITSALCQRIETYLDRPGYTEDIRKGIDIKRSENLFPPDYQAQIVEELCGDNYFKALQSLDVNTRNSVHDDIAWLAKNGIVSSVVTTNFDRLLEKAFIAQDIPFEVAYEPKTYEKCLQTLLDTSHEAPVQILKVHGCVQDHHSLIDTLKQRLIGRNTSLNRCLSTLLEKYFWLFVGFSATDLESDDKYLQLIPSAPHSPGITYVQWAGSKEFSKGASTLLNIYADKATKVITELDPFFKSIFQSLNLPNPPEIHFDQDINTKKEVKTSLLTWANDLHPAAAVNCLAGITEASGETELAFRLLHRFWKDVYPQDRNGSDFELYRFLHGRLGMGVGFLSLVDDYNTTTGEESLQNLLRSGHAGNGRALAWAGLAFMWAGKLGHALPLLNEAGDYFKHDRLSPEEKIDIWLAFAEFFYIFGEPESFIAKWEGLIQDADLAGDLPRKAKLLAFTLLYYAEFIPEEFDDFINKQVKPVFEDIKRLNDPMIVGFINLGQGRYFTKQRDGIKAIEALSRANGGFMKAARSPWRMFSSIEYAKALLDLKKVQEAADELNRIDEYADRYQILLVWLMEAKGQFHACLAQNDEARIAFEQSIDFANKFGLKRRAETLKSYLDKLRSPKI